GPYLDELRSKYGEWGNIYLLGRIPREELPELYSAADVFLFPSEADTFGMSVLEAQACGVPAIVSDKGGPRDIVIDGETGYVAAVGNREEWVGRIIELCEKTDSGEIDDIKRASIENARGRFSWENVFEDIFDELKPIQ
ncbi:MAG: glycosyltransferase family 4 protein, partial [Bacteroidota bacterium]